jgi:antirestriction protein ArdC
MGIYEDITTRIIQAIETGLDGRNWRMPWHGAGGRPMNIASGNLYRGMNVLTLWVESQAKGYGHSWGTFKQWQSIGARVRKGERGTPIVFWKNVPCEDNDEQTPRFILRSSVVFNAAQVDGYTPPQQVTPAPDRIPDAEAFIAAIAGLDLRFGGDRAYYNPGRDFVQIPEFRDFKTSHGYYATLLHETAHWSGHHKRLARDFSGRFGSEAYAFEELIAELTAAFLCGDLGLSNEPRPDHAEYIAGWLRVLNRDARAIFKASSEATKAADFLLAFSREKERAA